MHTIWGIIITLFGLLAWIGQIISTTAPKKAARLGLADAEKEVDPAFFADGQGEAFWDTLVLWSFPAAGILLILREPIWAYFGLVGGGMFLYFAGRGIFARLTLQRRKIPIGSRSTLKTAYFFLSLWGLLAVVTIIAAIISLTV